MGKLKTFKINSFAKLFVSTVTLDLETVPTVI